MTIGTSNRNDAVGNSTTKTYSYGFKIFAATDLRVTVKKTSTGVETLLTYPTNYAVTGVGISGGGTIVLAGSGNAWQDGSDFLATGYTITIRRVRPLTQATDLRNQAGFFAEVHEDTFDHLVMIDQQQQDDIGRSLRMPETTDVSVVSPVLPTPASLSIFGWNVGATALVNYVLQAGTSLVDLAASAGSSLIGFIQSGVGAVLRTMEAKSRDIVSIKDFGGVGDGVTNNNAAFAAVIAAHNGTIIPPGNYLISDTALVGDKSFSFVELIPGTVTITQSDPTKDCIRFTRTTGNYETTVKGVKTVGGLSGIRLDHTAGGYVSKGSIIENCHAVSPAHSGLRIEGGSAFINGKVRNFCVEGADATDYGIYVRGYNTINATQFQNITLIGTGPGGTMRGWYVEETTSTGYTVQVDNLTLESLGDAGLYLDGVDMTITNFYSEQCGETNDIADIVLISGNASWPTHLTLKNPYFGPVGAAQTGSVRIEFASTRCSLHIDGKADPGAYVIDGANFTSASFINLWGNAGQFTVTNFSNNEQRFGSYTESSYEAALTGCTAQPEVTVKTDRTGNVVTLTSDALISAVSNTTAKTLTGMPANLRPRADVGGPFMIVSDNGGAYTIGAVVVKTTGVIEVYTTPGAGAWTAAGTAAIDKFSITYVR